MELEFEFKNLDNSPSLQQHTRDKLDKIERRWGDRITRIRVFFSDVNADKGGADKHCTIEARLAGMEPLVAEALADKAYDAVNVTVDKLIRVLEHETKRRRGH